MLFASRGGAYSLRRCASVGTETMAKDNPRARRLGEQIQRELTDLLRRDVKDGRIGNVTITAGGANRDHPTTRGSYLGVGKEGPDPKREPGLRNDSRFLRHAQPASPM